MKITIIGFGNMGRAFAESLARNLKGSEVFVSDYNLKPNAKLGLRNLKADLKLKELPASDFVLLAVKPQDLLELSRQIKGRISPRSILISIAAGVPLARLVKIFNHRKTVRSMPNLAIQNGEGIIGWKAHGLDKKEKAKVRKLLTSVAENFEVKEERLIDAVTAVSGSGPAYFFLLGDALAQAALILGFNKAQADLLAAKTLTGAGAVKMHRPDASFRELIGKIASKKGTTEAALKYFSKKGFNRIVKNAAREAYNRAREISHE